MSPQYSVARLDLRPRRRLVPGLQELASTSQCITQTADVLEKTRPRGHKMVVFGQREADFGRCFDESIARAVDDVDSPELRAVHEQIRTGVVRVAANR